MVSVRFVSRWTARDEGCSGGNATLPLPLCPPRTWFDLAHSDSNFFPRGGGNLCRGDNSPRVISVWLRNQRRRERKGNPAGIQYSRWTWHAWKKLAERREKKERRRKRRNGDRNLDVSDHPFCFWQGEGALSLIKLNRDLISMGNVSTNWLGKDLCEWGTRYVTLLDHARLMGWWVMERGEEGRRKDG